MNAVRVRLFGPARDAAGRSTDAFDGATVGDVLDAAVLRYGTGFAALLGTCRVWVNGEQAGAEHPLVDGDEVAVLPPVSGG
jgi:MoaD family protein